MPPLNKHCGFYLNQYRLGNYSNRRQETGQESSCYNIINHFKNTVYLITFYVNMQIITASDYVRMSNSITRKLNLLKKTYIYKGTE